MKRILLALATALPLLASAQLNPVRIALNNWATGLTRPLWVAHAGDDRLFVVERGGIIKIIADSMQVLPAPFLNITAQVNSAQGEQGLLGLAFDPDHAVNGFFYVNLINLERDTEIRRYQVSPTVSTTAFPAASMRRTWPCSGSSTCSPSTASTRRPTGWRNRAPVR